MLSLLWSQLLAVLTAPLLWTLRGLRQWIVGRRGVVEVTLSSPGPRWSLDNHIATLVALQRVAQSPAVRAVLVRVNGPRYGWAAAQEIRDGLAAMRRSGKLLVAHGDVFGNQELFITAPCDRIWASPAGEVHLAGIGARLTFFGGALERIGVRADIESAGAYKSFGESFSRTHPTAENREAVLSLVGDLQKQLVAGITRWRKVEAEAIDSLMARSPVPLDEAVEAGLIDGVAYPDQVLDKLDEMLGGKQRMISLGFLTLWLSVERWLERLGQRKERLAVVHLEGPIVHGGDPAAGGAHRIEANRVVPALEQLREDDSVRGVVLYINSGGGSALASDLIARAVSRVEEKKPVVSVFGDAAASGGYYLAAPSAELIAQPGTLTGSIGVVGGKMVWTEGAGQLGITTEAITAGPNSDLYSPWSGFTPKQRERFRESLRRVYDRFLQVVAAGRHAPVDAIEPFAEGRVWTGQQAREHGLVDRIGGLFTGLSRTRELAGISDRPVSEIHIRFPPPRLRLVQGLLSGARVDLLGLVSRGTRGLGPTSEFVQLLREHPLEPLAVSWWTLEDGVNRNDQSP